MCFENERGHFCLLSSVYMHAAGRYTCECCTLLQVEESARRSDQSLEALLVLEESARRNDEVL